MTENEFIEYEVRQHLKECVTEYIRWEETGILPQGKIRGIAACLKDEYRLHQRLQRVRGMVEWVCVRKVLE